MTTSDQEVLNSICSGVASFVVKFNAPTMKDPAERGPHVYTFVCFIAMWDSEWLLITAGHCISKFQEHRLEYDVIGRSLYDCLSEDSKFKSPIPATFLGDDFPEFLYVNNFIDGVEIDAAILPLVKHYKDLLVKNNIKPFYVMNKDALKHKKYKEAICVGLPKDHWRPMATQNFSQADIAIKPVLIPLDMPDSPYDEEGRIHAKVRDRGTLATLKGMSGGPVLASIDGKFELIGVQTDWDEEKNEIRACPIHTAITHLLSTPEGKNLWDNIHLK